MDIDDPPEAMRQRTEFDAIWEAIKGWDIRVNQDDGYSSATGSHVAVILNALDNIEPNHIVWVTDSSFTIEHPLAERLAGTMHECELMGDMQRHEGPPVSPGKYRAVKVEHDPTSESFRSGAMRWKLELL